MSLARCLLVLSLLSGEGLCQDSQHSAPAEEAIQKTIPERKLDKDDVQCGNYLWISTKNGEKFLYYFFGSTEWGKGRIGFYQQSLYRAVVSPEKDPPTVQRVMDSKGMVTGVRIQMTAAELVASSACLTAQ